MMKDSSEKSSLTQAFICLFGGQKTYFGLSFFLLWGKVDGMTTLDAPPSSFSSRLLLLVGILAGMAGLVWVFVSLPSWLALEGTSPEEVLAQAKPEQRAVFVGKSAHPDLSIVPVSAQCGACHAEIFKTWANSDHAWANRPLQAGLDAEPFQGLGLEAHHSKLSFLTGKNGQRVVKERSSGREWPVAMAIGRVPLVQYLVPSGDGGYHTTSAAWDTLKKEWFDMFGVDSRQEGEWGHWTGRGMIWNTQCAWCHMSDFQKGYDTKTHQYASTWKEMGVTCIQCHSPVLEKGEQGTGCLVSTGKKFSLKQQADNCASCHARRDELDNNFKMGSAFEDHFILSLPTQRGLFWPNGMQRDEVYTETGLKLSRMGKAGVQCLDCHDAHSGKLKKPLEDNSICLQCHATGERKAPIIEPEKHSHHKEGSLGNRCVECHMPESPYMARDPRRDHAMASPDPLLSEELGTPNACIMCHKDKTNTWAQTYVNEWYGDLPKTAKRERTRAVHHALEGTKESFEGLISSLEKEENTYWRATLLGLLEEYSTHPRVHAEALKSAKSENALERYHVARLFGVNKHPSLVPLLLDKARIVRVQAAWELREMLPREHPAMKELEASAHHQGDQPGGAMKLAQLHAVYAAKATTEEARALESAQAEAWFKKALEWDSSSSIVPRDYAVFLASQGRGAEAVTQLERAVALEPKNPHFLLLLSLGKAEQGDKDGAIESLGKALDLDKTFVRAYYNRALLLAEKGNLDLALKDLEEAEKLAAHTPDFLYTQAVLLYQAQRLLESRAKLESLLRKFPNHREGLILRSKL